MIGLFKRIMGLFKRTNKKHWSTKLPSDACADAVEWSRTQPNLKTAWKTCHRGDWMMWLLGRLVETGSEEHRRLVLCACDCAESVAHLATDDGKIVIARCLTITRDWALGGSSSIEDVRCAYAVIAYAAARADKHLECADIVREHFPNPPML